MKRNGLYIILCAILAVLLFLPMIQQHAHPFSLRKLDGAALESDCPELRFETYKDQSYQTQLEKYVGDHFGFREWVIRLYNQYLWLYRKTYAADVVVGKDRWLYGISGVQDHYRQLAYEFAESNEALERQFEKDLDRLSKVQDLLEQRGVRFFVMVCPSKEVLYPEHLSEYGKRVMGDGLRAREYYLKAFGERGIHCLDLCTWFQQIKDTVDYPIFPQTGLHWSDIACAHAADTMIRYMEDLTGKNMPNIRLGAPYWDKTLYPDNDLEKSMNLIWPIRPNQNLYAKATMVPDSTAQRLRLLTIGDSFIFNFGYVLPMDKLFKTHHHWYYFSSVFYDPDHTHVSQVDLLEEFRNTDVVMLCFNTSKLYNINCGFLSRALVELSLDSPEALERIVDDIKHQMENNEAWQESLKKKAVDRGQSLEQVMREDALYLISQNPEAYLD